MSAKLLCGCACGVALALFGCGGGSDQAATVKVTGKVYLDDALQTSGRITLDPVNSAGKVPAPPSVGGTIGSDGTYMLTTYAPGDGAPPGDYNVTMNGTTVESGTTDPAAMMAMMGGGAAGTNTLTITVPADGSTALDLKFITQNAGGKGGKMGGGGAPAPLGASGL